MEANYFTCTLGEAAQNGLERPFASINQLLVEQAEKHPDLPAIGFYRTADANHQSSLQTKVLTFHQLRAGVVKAANFLSRLLGSSKGQTVALLAASSPEFLFTWLGGIWLGHSVLLIAPQCSGSAIVSLCSSCQVSVLLVDDRYEELGRSSCQEAAFELKCCRLPFDHTADLLMNATDMGDPETEPSVPSSGDVAYFHHTSGTSSGVPKPIAQTQYGAVGAIPALEGQNYASFTTTPLYHGGPADIFRAWASNAMIWLFPGKDLPITAKNVISCLEASYLTTLGTPSIPPIRYFTSVPYILQMMAEDIEGLSSLQKMDLVGVGGAALPVEVGNKLVHENVRLVSRFGAAECGFLLSSHRDYAKDRDWQFLRHTVTNKLLTFEAQENALYELVVGPEWPHMAKRNREDGSYATSDLFEKHATIANAWRYHSRADSQLTLITGKKFDPAPLENALTAASTLISDVLIFGNGQPSPGALLFRSALAKEMTDDEITDSISAKMESLNKQSQSHARITRNMLLPMPYVQSPLDKSSKGTVLRSKAEEKYANQIEAAYTQAQPTKSEVPDEKLEEVILELIQSTTGGLNENLSAESDLFEHGVDSVACVQIRHGLLRLLPRGSTLPRTIVEDSGTVANLSGLLRKLRWGEEYAAASDRRKQILDLVEHYSELDDERPVESMTNGFTTTVEPPGKTVLLTGATGSLGSHVLHQLLHSPTISHIYILVRGSSPQAARERVRKALESRWLDLPASFDTKASILQGKLSDPDLGIPFLDYSTLQSEIDLVLHLAWSVNFLLSLQSFKPHFAAMQNLLNLCMSSTKLKPPRFVFCSSVAAVSNFSSLNPEHTGVPEELLPQLSASGDTGYALSKLTAELILGRAATAIPSLHNRITILRVGQLSADTQHGIWNKSEAYPQILASAKLTSGRLPDLGPEEKLTWLPVDVAAKSFVEASLTEPEMIQNVPTEQVKHQIGERPVTATIIEGSEERPSSMTVDPAAVKVLHLVNPDNKPTFSDFLNQLQRLQKGDDKGTGQIQLVTAQEWLQALHDIETVGKKPIRADAQALLRLLPFWQQAYGHRQSTFEAISSDKPAAGMIFNMHSSFLTMPSLTHWLGLSTLEGRSARPIDGSNKEAASELLKKEYVLKIWDWVQKNVP